MTAKKKVFHHMVLIFHSFKGFSDMEDFWDELPVSFLKYNALEDFQDDLPGSLLTESSHMSPFYNRSERFGFQIWNRLWKTSRKSYRRYILEDFQEDFP
ncbi:hypothetical protein F2Q69_00012197 [Brassica cretica]|uniref:Uncharacterized protein n=1 Tax=Brassica cretica TaxID=69181 RepID=A0A8S9QVZ6_BRACR|nr:hypothetical protein F2Q69_00012197 [Brassica cretica]